MPSTIKTIWQSNRLAIIITALAVLAIVIIMLQAASVRKYRQRAKIAENNIEVLKDSVRVTYNKWQEAEFQKKSFVVQEPQDLKALTADLYAELQKIKGEIKSIQKVAAVIVHDTVPLVVTHTSPSIWNFSFDTTYNENNYEKFKGFIDTENPLNSRRTYGELGLDLILAIRSVNGNPEIVAKSNFPNLRFTKIEGAQIDKNYFKSATAQSPLIRASLTVGQNLMEYNYNTKQLKFLQPEIDANVGFSVDLNKLFKKK